MRAKTGITIACLSALSLVNYAGAGLRAQTPPSPSQPSGVATQDSANDLSVAVGKTVLVDIAWPIKRIANNMAEIADVHATSPTEVMVQGRTPGETSLIIWDTHGGRQFFNVTVRPNLSALNDNLDAIRRELRTELPGQTLKISTENGSIFLRGTVKDLDSSDRAVRIAGAALPIQGATGGKVVNLLNVTVPDGDQQILLKVRFASVDRSAIKQLGVNVLDEGGLNTSGGVTTGQFSEPAGLGSLTGLNLFAGPIGNLPIAINIAALESKGLVEILAEPNVLAINGKEASFLSGGEYPYPMVQAGAGGSGSTVTVQFKEYGVRLNFIPTITPRGTIRLQVAPEVSALDFADAVEISGFEVPAISSRRMKTEVELADGQSFVIGGLLDNRDNELFTKVPFLGSIPILGKFFQSVQKTKSNAELIVIVTPEIVAPIQAGTPLPQLKFPGKFLPPSSGIPMNTPDAKTAENTPAPPPAAIPVETLLNSMKPEPALLIDNGGGSSAISAPTAASGPAPGTASAASTQ